MRVVALILAGGAGTRLGVLSEQRAKPAVPFAGRFRIIDFTLSNCVNSGIFDVGVLTQYLPRSLNDHIGIGRPWDLDRAVAACACCSPTRAAGIRSGTAAQPMRCCRTSTICGRRRADTVVILSGDHIYKMDYRPMLQRARRAPGRPDAGGDERRARRNLPFRHRADGRGWPGDAVPGKAQGGAQHAGQHGRLRLQRQRADRTDAGAASQHPDLDFGKHVIPSMVESHGIYTYPFEGYWVDVGTVDAYWSTSMELVLRRVAAQPLRSELGDPHQQRRTRSRQRWGRRDSIQQSMICNGCIVRGQVIRSVLSPASTYRRAQWCARA